MNIQVNDLTFAYQEKTLFKEFNLTIPSGKTTIITGTSGCGKSTLCYLMAGLYPQYAGELIQGNILIGGQDIHSLSVQARSQLVGMMFQNPTLQFCMDSVENELIFCLENQQIKSQDISDRVADALNFCQISHLRERLIHTLSGGEKQLVQLACVIALKSRTLFLDEPFANLDRETIQLLIDKIGQYQKRYGITLIIVDHQVEHFAAVADEIIVLSNQGEIQYRDRIHCLNSLYHQLNEIGLASPNHPYSVFNRSSLKENASALFKLDQARLENSQINLTAEFKLGVMTAITGRSGCGKSTLLETLAKMRSYRGSIEIVDVKSETAKEIKKSSLKKYAQTVGIVFQNPQDQFITNTVYDELKIGASPRVEDEQLKVYLSEIGLWDYRDLSPYMLSQGQQRLLAVMALLVCECKILLCDEPTYGLDRKTATILMNFLKDKVAQGQLTVIFTTHDEQLAADFGEEWFQYHKEFGLVAIERDQNVKQD